MKRKTFPRNVSAIPIVASILALSVVGGLCASPLYETVVKSHNPRAYYRFNDTLVRSNINANSGSAGAAGNITNTPNVRSILGGIVGSSDRATFYDNGTSYGMIPYTAALNPTNTQPFTVEVWLNPSSDQINVGMSPINNRVSSGFPDRTGWVFFQRAPASSYSSQGGYEGVGWNMRMYRGSGGATGNDVTSDVPFQVGKWAHVVVVYDPVDLTNSTLTMYIDGVAAKTNVWNGGPDGTAPGYAANPSNTDAALSLGAYNNTSGAGNNPYFGGIDEFAFYHTKLTPAEILAHYQNATNANRTISYDALVAQANPVVHLCLNEQQAGADQAINYGDVRNNGRATHSAEVRHPAFSALAGRANDGSAAYHSRNGFAVTTMPWLSQNNPNAGVPFSIELWVRPMRDQQAGHVPINNRMVGGTGRTGWIIYERNPNLTYPPSEGHGWELRMYNGVNTSGSDCRTETDFKIGEWGHLVYTWEPTVQNGDLGSNGNDQWGGKVIAYFNGVAVNTNENMLYSANREVPEAGQNNDIPADFAVGAYNAASTLGNNQFEGDVDEIAIYTNRILTAEQVLAHYMVGTNANPATNYETLVLTAGYDGAPTTPQRTGPSTYLRFNEPAYYPATNSGTLAGADGNLVRNTNNAAGPVTAGFDNPNTAVAIDPAAKGWVSLNNPSGLNFSGQITLEAWVQLGATQNDPARIISHGPQTLSDFLATPPDFAVTNTSEVFLRVEGANPYTYVVGSAQVENNVGTNYYTASAPVPAGDVGGSSYVHLAGTYDGTTWRLYRNGVQIASAAAAQGALTVTNGDWAIGSTGQGWEQYFTGKIDEVAIYSSALSANTIAAHYYVGTNGPVSLSIAKGASGTVTVTWPAGTLQESTSVGGTYTDVMVSGNPATSPYNTATGTTKFYRIKL